MGVTSLPSVENKSFAVLIVSAGNGSRLGGTPKQYRLLKGKAILRHTLDAFRQVLPEIPIIVAIDRQHHSMFDAACVGLVGVIAVRGGATRQQSVRAGLAALQDSGCERVLVHDAARPFVSPELIARVMASTRRCAAAVPVLPVTDTIKQIAGDRVTGTPERATLRAVQTPQGFHLEALIEAHARFADLEATDDASLMEWAGHDVVIVEGDPANRKITTVEDWQWLEAMEQKHWVIRVGQGIDVHRFRAHAKGEAAVIRLGGIDIPHSRRLEGHSDADAVLHAITDAILSVIGEGDIGRLFLPSDPQWKGADSRVFLVEAARRLRDRGGRVNYIDVTVVSEQPKIGPHREAMQRAIAGMLEVSEGKVNVKATTTERLGFNGREEGLTALALVTASLPDMGH